MSETRPPQTQSRTKKLTTTSFQRSFLIIFAGVFFFSLSFSLALFRSRQCSRKFVENVHKRLESESLRMNEVTVELCSYKAMGGLKIWYDDECFQFDWQTAPLNDGSNMRTQCCVCCVLCARCILLKKNYELFNAYRSVLSTCNDIHFDRNIIHRASSNWFERRHDWQETKS